MDMVNEETAKPEEEWVWIRLKDVSFAKYFRAPRNEYKIYFSYDTT